MPAGIGKSVYRAVAASKQDDRAPGAIGAQIIARLPDLVGSPHEQPGFEENVFHLFAVESFRCVTPGRQTHGLEIRPALRLVKRGVEEVGGLDHR